jgi:hypothetical protein
MEKQINFYYDYESALKDVLDLLANKENKNAIKVILRNKKHIKRS